ncbi:MAG: hypothetical protein FWB96_11495 [Defluviitaleaceae bacterium]|nr:hypothetical protein [Defluviitaleaceae bacterium]MCL2263687.1 hypothetical protein [Defluviitaleaceae bacterium]
MGKMQTHRRQLLNRLGATLENNLSVHFMDIRRTSQTEGIIREVYSNVSVHASRSAIDNPDVANAATSPVVVNVTLHMKTDVDIQNGDTVIVKLPDENAESILDAFQGICGDPYTVNSRKRANLTMKQLGRESIISDVTPLPTESGE